jgi:hypothetical protein
MSLLVIREPMAVENPRPVAAAFVGKSILVGILSQRIAGSSMKIMSAVIHRSAERGEFRVGPTPGTTLRFDDYAGKPGTCGRLRGAQSGRAGSDDDYVNA